MSACVVDGGAGPGGRRLRTLPVRQVWYRRRISQVPEVAERSQSSITASLVSRSKFLVSVSLVMRHKDISYPSRSRPRER